MKMASTLLFLLLLPWNKNNNNNNNSKKNSNKKNNNSNSSRSNRSRSNSSRSNSSKKKEVCDWSRQCCLLGCSPTFQRSESPAKAAESERELNVASFKDLLDNTFQEESKLQGASQEEKVRANIFVVQWGCFLL